MRKRSLLVWSLIGVVAFVGNAAADPVPIRNAGFEEFVLADGFFTRHIGSGIPNEIVHPDPIPGWDVPRVVRAGTLNPTTVHLAAAAEGENTAYTGGATISQLLDVVVAANTLYTLEVEVGRRFDIPFRGYGVQLVAAGQVLAEDPSSVLPPLGGFATSTLVYAAQTSDPGIGEQLEIRLSAPGPQANFDLVRLDATLLGPEVSQVEIDIDVKPRRFPNIIFLKSGARIPVAILSTRAADGDAMNFAAESVDVDSLRLEGAPAVRDPIDGPALVDVDSDGDLDLVVHFDTVDVNLRCCDQLAVLVGTTLDGVQIMGGDLIVPSPSCSGSRSCRLQGK